MKPSDEFIEKFQKIYLEEFGQETSREEAYEKFLRLVNFLRVILRRQSQKDQESKSAPPFSSEFDQILNNDKMK